MTEPPRRKVHFSDLGLRVASGVALAALALFDLWLGGFWVAALAALAAVLMQWELHRMVTGEDRLGVPGLAVLTVAAAAAVLVTGWTGIGWGVLCLIAGAAAVAVLVRDRAGWLAGGLVYTGFAMAYVVVIRDDPALGLAAVMWLILVVVAADVGAYFAGRSIGGPKLWPRVSPKKTWSGAIGGLAFAVAVGAIFAAAAAWPLAMVVALAAGVALASQAGDLLESTVKRHWGVKDASQLIPGHGGVMDRLDGLMGGLWFFALYDILGGTLGG